MYIKPTQPVCDAIVESITLEASSVPGVIKKTKNTKKQPKQPQVTQNHIGTATAQYRFGRSTPSTLLHVSGKKDQTNSDNVAMVVSTYAANPYLTGTCGVVVCTWPCPWQYSCEGRWKLLYVAHHGKHTGERRSGEPANATIYRRAKILTLHESVLGCMAQSNHTTACTVGILIGMQLV